MKTEFVATATDMVRVVQSIIQSYDMGSVRALAQEPVQNSKDAKCQSQVCVAYRLHKRSLENGRECFLLTVTDYGTTGLQGTIIPRAVREARGLELGPGENWAAFEGQGFTRKDRSESLGSRGQGKSAFLYHSRPFDPDGNPLNRYLMLYDTLLANGEYRLGVRYATPADMVREPPLLNDAAREMLRVVYHTGDGTVVPLRLNPLEQPGTRIIIPFLSEEALRAVRSGELHRWLQRCWWRAIQIGNLDVRVTDVNGQSTTIQPPVWWRDDPWQNRDKRVAISENIPVGDGLEIKRIVLFYDENLEADEIDDHSVQYSGVQLLRDQQWIETLDVRDFVPKERLKGFRGFAEFERQLERELKKSEKPQHESFNGQYAVVRSVRNAIRAAVKQFAEKKGWLTETDTQDVPERVQEVAMEFLNVFAGGNGTTRRGQQGGRGGQGEDSLNWQCALLLDFPTAKSTRVNWGEIITNVGITVECEPFQSTKHVDLSLELSYESETKSVKVVERKGVAVPEGGEIFTFGDFQVVQGHAGEGKMRLAKKGEWTLRAAVRYRGEEVATARRRLYLEEDPPELQQPKPHTISVSVKNISRQDQLRVNNGDEISVQVTITNRAAEEAVLRVDASLEDLLLADGKEVKLAGVPAGDVPNREAVVSRRLWVHTSPQLTSRDSQIVLEPGRYYLRADLRASDSDEIIHHSQPIYIEIDPGGNRSRLPFTLESIEDNAPHPMWQLEKRSDDDWVLKFPSQYPLYDQLRRPQRQTSKLAGQSSFIAEICANGLIEWALDPLNDGDWSRVDQLRESHLNGSLAKTWEVYISQLDRLADLYGSERIDDTSAYMNRWRQAVATMLDLYESME